MINKTTFHHLHLATSPAEKTAEDELATQNLLEAYQDATGYTCPICKQHHTDPGSFIEHLVIEINQQFDQITEHGLHAIPKREETK